MKSVVRNARVFDGEKLCEVRDVLFENGVICDEFTGTESEIKTFDGTGCLLLPGLIDSHIHLNSIDNLTDAVNGGVTTMLDMATGSDELIDNLRHKEGLTDIESCHQPIVSEAGELLLQAMETSMAEHMRENYVSKISDVKTQVDVQIDKGADYIKVILGEAPLMKVEMTPEILHEIVNYSHERGKMVHVHTTSVHTYELAVNAGVDVLHHLPQGEIIPQAVINIMKSKDLTAVPTLLMDKGMCEVAKHSMPERGADYSLVKQNFETLHNAGVRIIAGTDANYTNKMNFLPHGKSMHTELELMTDAGFTTLEALVSATSLPAKTFGLGKRGVISCGYRADLLLIEGNPLDNISDIKNIRKIWVAGVEVKS